MVKGLLRHAFKYARLSAYSLHCEQTVIFFLPLLYKTLRS
jgi:hypothetical protein